MCINCVCVCMCVYVRVRVRASVYVCVFAFGRHDLAQNSQCLNSLVRITSEQVTSHTCICVCVYMYVRSHTLLRRHSHDPQTHLFVSLFLTGVGAKIGGFAGDALPVARVMSSLVDTLITHPNVIFF